MSILSAQSLATTAQAVAEAIPCSLDDAPVLPVGQPAAWLSFERQHEEVILRPVRPMPRRCMIRPAALFDEDRSFPLVTTVMGQLLFPRGATEPQTYRPFTRDPKRRLRELFFPVEAMPEDDWPTSQSRWSNYQAIAKRLLSVAGIAWDGLSSRDVHDLVNFVPWAEPLEGCVLHALMQWAHERGTAVIEVGSLQGRSLAMLAMALRGVASDALLISIDPHADQPHNPSHVRLTLRHIGEEDRLVQIRRTSDEACRVLRPGIASLIFIDGDHSYEQVRADFENYRSFLAPGGVLAFHDYGFGSHNGQPDTHPGVREVIDRHVVPTPGLRPLLLAHTLFAFVRDADA